MKVKTIDADKLAKAIEKMIEVAEQKHQRNIAIELARFEQEREDWSRFYQMLHCTNYEKETV